MANQTGSLQTFGQNSYMVNTLQSSIDSIQAFPATSTTTFINNATTTVVSAVPCWCRINAKKGTAGLVTVYNNTAASGTAYYTDTPATNQVILQDYTYFSTGVTIVTAAATELLVETLVQI